MSQYRLSAEAQRDLDEIWDYIAADNPCAADRWIDDVEERLRLLGAQPLLGQDRPDLVPGLRFLPVGDYIIFYLPLTDGVEVARVIHGARDYGSEYFRRPVVVPAEMKRQRIEHGVRRMIFIEGAKNHLSSLRDNPKGSQLRGPRQHSAIRARVVK